MLNVALKRSPEGAVLALGTCRAAGGGILTTMGNLFPHVLTAHSYPL